MSSRIFISYRRTDDRRDTGRLLTMLQQSFQPDQLFADAEPVEPGDNVARSLGAKIADSDVLVAIIGPQWSEAADARGGRRLDQATDVVRVAIEAALSRGKRIIPVLIGGAEMPAAAQLPESLRPLTALAAVRIGDDSFRTDAERLVKTLGDQAARRPRGWAIWPAVAIGLTLILGVLSWPWWHNAQAPISNPVGPSPQIAEGSRVAPSPPIMDAQRAVLYEEDPTNAQGQQSVGQVVWRIDPGAASNGRPTDPVVRAGIEIPDRAFKLTVAFRINHDAALPASHTIELKFTLPPDFPGGSIDSVPGILTKSNEQARGVPLAGLTVKVTNGFFLFGLSNADADRARNIRLLKEQAWFDLPMVYATKRRAILAIEKGASGERAFNDAFSA